MTFDINRIEKSVKRVRKFIKKDRKRPNMKEIHDLRTSATRLESAFNALGLNSKWKQKRLLDALSEARKKAGKVRDMDVLTGHALNLSPNNEEQDCLVQLIEYLGAKRAKGVRNLRLALTKTGSRLRRELDRVSQDVETILGKANKASNAQAAQVAAESIKLSSELNKPRRLNKNNLHEYRLKVKELLYVLQLSDRADNQQFVEKLREVKDAIGEWHDFVELTRIAQKVLDHAPSCKILQQLQSHSNSRYEKSLSLSTQLRSIYLNSRTSKRGDNRRAKRSPRLVPLVLTAASAITQH